MSNTTNGGNGRTPVSQTWTTRAKVRKATTSGEVVPNEFSFGGELVRVSPRFRNTGNGNFRVSPERPAAFFAAFCVENAIIPAMTAEEAESDAGREVLAPVFAACVQYFHGLEPTGTEKDSQADLKTGFSFLVPQVLVQKIGFADVASRAAIQPTVNAALAADVAKKLEEMRAKATAKKPAEAKPDAKKK